MFRGHNISALMFRGLHVSMFRGHNVITLMFRGHNISALGFDAYVQGSQMSSHVQGPAYVFQIWGLAISRSRHFSEMLNWEFL